MQDLDEDLKHQEMKDIKTFLLELERYRKSFEINLKEIFTEFYKEFTKLTEMNIKKEIKNVKII